MNRNKQRQRKNYNRTTPFKIKYNQMTPPSSAMKMDRCRQCIDLSVEIKIKNPQRNQFAFFQSTKHRKHAFFIYFFKPKKTNKLNALVLPLQFAFLDKVCGEFFLHIFGSRRIRRMWFSFQRIHRYIRWNRVLSPSTWNYHAIFTELIDVVRR